LQARSHLMSLWQPGMFMQNKFLVLDFFYFRNRKWLNHFSFGQLATGKKPQKGISSETDVEPDSTVRSVWSMSWSEGRDAYSTGLGVKWRPLRHSQKFPVFSLYKGRTILRSHTSKNNCIICLCKSKFYYYQFSLNWLFFIHLL